MPRIIALELIALLFFANISSAQYSSAYPEGFIPNPDQESSSEFLPRGRPFPPLPTDPRDLKLGIRKNSLQQVEGDIGGYRSIYGWKSEVNGSPLVLHTGIEGNAYFTMRHSGSKFPLESSDGLFGLYAEAVRNAWFYQLRFSHISAHLADGAANVTQAIVYSREFLDLRIAHQMDWIRPYAGIIELVHSLPGGLPAFGEQVGFYAIPNFHWGQAHPYLGSDYRHRGGREGSTLNFSAGVLLASTQKAPPIRIAANYLTGHDLRGQFFDQYIHKFSVGLELDF